MSQRRRGAAGLIIMATCVIAGLAWGCGGSTKQGPAAVPTNREAAARQPVSASDLPAGRIAFRRFLDDAHTQGAVFTIKTDGTADRQITDPPAGTVDDQPDWSPDGKQIAFERCSDAKGCTAWTVAANGGKPREARVKSCRLKGVGCDVSAPAWMPDGRLVVVLAQGRERRNGDVRQIEQSKLELLDLAHGTQRTIVKRTNWAGDTAAPAVAPDRRTIVYTRVNSWLTKPPFGAALHSVRIDGSGDRRITPYELGGGDHPAFSPTGGILFRSFEDNESRQSDFWTVKPDGAALKQLTHFETGTLVLSGSYSPDGHWIVHASGGVDGNADLYVMRADGSGNRPLTRTKAWDSAPDWGPPGT